MRKAEAALPFLGNLIILITVGYALAWLFGWL